MTDKPLNDDRHTGPSIRDQMVDRIAKRFITHAGDTSDSTVRQSSNLARIAMQEIQHLFDGLY